MLSQAVNSPETLFNNLLTELNSKSRTKGGWQGFGDLESLDKLKKVNADILDTLIQDQLNKKQPKQPLYQSLQLIYEDELKRRMNSLFYSSEDRATPNRLEALDKLLIKHFGFAGFVTPLVFASLQDDGGSGQFKAMQVLCLAQLMLEQYPKHESIQLVNNYFMENGKDEVPMLETKDGKAYISGALLSELIEAFSKEFNYSGDSKLDKATPAQKIEMAFALAKDTLSKLQISKEEKIADKAISQSSTLQLLATFPQQISGAKIQQTTEAKISSESKTEPLVKKEEEQNRMFTSPADEKKSDPICTKKEIASIDIKPNRAAEEHPPLYFVNISYTDGTKEKQDMYAGSIWKNYFKFLNKDDQQIFTRKLYEEEHCFLPSKDQEAGLPTELPGVDMDWLSEDSVPTSPKSKR